jgi:hypothetical protein
VLEKVAVMQFESHFLPEPIRMLDAELSKLLPRVSRNRGRLLSLALTCCSRERICDILEAVCEDELLLASCARSSVAHPLGFDKFALMSSDLYQVRLHIWWPGGMRGREDIHNHRFPFVSAVIVGQLNISIYKIARTGTAMLRFQENRQAGGAGYRYVRLANVQVRQSGGSSCAAGNAYYMRSDILHRVDVADSNLAATLFVRIPRAIRSTTVLVDPAANAPAEGARPRFDLAETRQRLQTFATLLAA